MPSWSFTFSRHLPSAGLFLTLWDCVMHVAIALLVFSPGHDVHSSFASCHPPTLSSLSLPTSRPHAGDTQQPETRLVRGTAGHRDGRGEGSWEQGEKPIQVPERSQGRADLWLVGYSSTVITSRAFQAAMLVPQNRHCQPIIADSLLPKNRKKQQTAESSMEPPVKGGRGHKEA